MNVNIYSKDHFFFFFFWNTDLVNRRQNLKSRGNKNSEIYFSSIRVHFHLFSGDLCAYKNQMTKLNMEKK